MPLRANQTIREGDFIKKSERNATKSNDVDRVPRLESDGFLDGEFVRYLVSLPVIQDYNGTTTPQALTSVVEGGVMLADANDDAALRAFLGFGKENKTGFYPEFLYINTTDSGTVSLTIPAGNNVVLIVAQGKYSSGSSLATAYTFNGVAMTASVTITGPSFEALKYWYIPLGNLASPLTANLVRTGGASTSGQTAQAYKNVDQTTPFLATGGTSANNGTIALTGNSQYTRAVVASLTGNSISITNADITNRGNSGGGTGVTIDDFRAIGSPTVTTSTTGGSHIAIAALLKKAGTAPNSTTIYYGGIVNGFTGLTTGAKYYVQDTGGAIGLTPGTNTILAGMAVSATEILILR